ncbi:MAG: hypothetical protein HOW59_30255 [Nonomuraea sp.]|nr:hypothetical protein [Nonomuraea sp.]
MPEATDGRDLADIPERTRTRDLAGTPEPARMRDLASTTQPARTRDLASTTQPGRGRGLAGMPETVHMPESPRTPEASAAGAFEGVGVFGVGRAFEGFADRGGSERLPDTAPFAPVFDTGPMEAISLPPATSAFDAFAPAPRPDISATYQGRRRRSEEPVEAFVPFEAELPPRGRRHRRTGAGPENPWSLRSVGGTSPVESFLQDLPLRGRRHRAPAAEDAHRLVGAGDGGEWPGGR